MAASPEGPVWPQLWLAFLMMRTGLGCTVPFGFLTFKMRVAKGNRSGQESILLPQPDSTVLFLPFDHTQNNRNRTISPGGAGGGFIVLSSCGRALPDFILHRGLHGRKSGRPWAVSPKLCSLQRGTLGEQGEAAMLATPQPRPQQEGDQPGSPQTLNTGSLRGTGLLTVRAPENPALLREDFKQCRFAQARPFSPTRILPSPSGWGSEVCKDLSFVFRKAGDRHSSGSFRFSHQRKHLVKGFISSQ